MALYLVYGHFGLGFKCQIAPPVAMLLVSVKDSGPLCMQDIDKNRFLEIVFGVIQKF